MNLQNKEKKKQTTKQEISWLLNGKHVKFRM